MKLLAISFGFLSWLFVVIAYGNWNSYCFKQYPTGTKISNGLGCAVTAWIIILVVLVLHVCTPVSLTMPASSSESYPAEPEVKQQKQQQSSSSTPNNNSQNPSENFPKSSSTAATTTNV
jgi:flagellar basal body-associated protein FliL